MENSGNYEVTFQLKSDSTYIVNIFNLYFNRFKVKEKPQIKKGKLNKNEFKHFKYLLQKAKIFEMKNDYGFNDSNKEGDIFYMIELNIKGKSKFVTINSNSNEKFSKHFNELIKYTNKYINL